MCPKIIPKEIKEKCEKLLSEKTYTYREIGRQTGISHMSVERIKQKRFPRTKQPEIALHMRERVPLTINIVKTTLTKIDKQRGQKSRSDTINEILKNWLNKNLDVDMKQIPNQIIERFSASRQKYGKHKKTVVNIDKNIRSKLEDIQREIESNFLVYPVKGNSKMTLEDTVDVWKKAELLETNEHKRKAISIAQIINIILGSEQQ